MGKMARLPLSGLRTLSRRAYPRQTRTLLPRSRACASGWEYRNPDSTTGGHGPESATARRRELLKIKIEALFEANDSVYGYRRMHAALARGGEQAGPELVRQLMRELGLVACEVPRTFRTVHPPGWTIWKGSSGTARLATVLAL